MTPPTLLLTLGDAAGIGPEVLVKALRIWNPPEGLHVEIIGEAEILARALQSCGIESLPASVQVKSLGKLSSHDYQLGRPQATTGAAAYAYFEEAIQACLSGRAHGIVTAPISKEGLQAAGHSFVGHTDILDHFTGHRGVVMALWHPRLVVSHVTDHMSLRQALDAITPERIEQVVRLTQSALVAAARFGPEGYPRIALAGVNPHAGENGIFGDEEIKILIPAMKRLAQQGIPTLGPFAGDTIFWQGLRGAYEAVIAMYHDQGFGPMKTIGFSDGVNCTLGLPFVRTSPDHGTAYGLAGTGKAEPESMVAALELAAKLISVH